MSRGEGVQAAPIRSRENALLASIRKLIARPGGYRDVGRIWLEGEHLVAACSSAGFRIEWLVLAASASTRPAIVGLAERAERVARVDDRLFAQLQTLESPAPIGAIVVLPPPAAPAKALLTVVLDRLQDPGNVGSVLRSAAAFGVRQVVAIEGTAALWSPKVLRAGMGAHFSLSLVENASLDTVCDLGQPLVAASPHAEATIREADWPAGAAWIFGHEGQGVASALIERCSATLRIPQPGGGESLNVAAAAAVCLYEHAQRRAVAAAADERPRRHR